MGKSYIVNGHKLYIETFGKTDSEPILYFHGKPGIGVIDLTEFQKEMLEKQFFIIAPEQYGVWRSESIAKGEKWGIEKIIDDYEQIRKMFGIKKVNLLCHCLGACYAMIYVQRYSNHVKKIVFESPVIDVMESNKNIIKYYMECIISIYGLKKEEEYTEELKKIFSIKDLELFMFKLQNECSDAKNGYMMANSTLEKIQDIKKIYDNANEHYLNSCKTAEHLINEYYLFDWKKYLGDLKKHECLVMLGKQDRMVRTKALESFINALENRCKVFELDECQHWIKIDQSQMFSSIVQEFIKNKV